MITNNKLDKSFGPVGTTAGLVLFVVGLITTVSSFYGLILIVLGAFVGFTSTSTFIDIEQKRIKFSNNIFGIISIGKWIPVEPTMKIGIKESNVTWSAFSQGNRNLDIEQKDFRIWLYDSDNREMLPLMKTDSIESAQAEMIKLCTQMGL
ncbi:MAG: hypothetical protein Q8908_05730 [Bacteroidota bacterium]|nr:hypothetical protein [Bacteroidota bacterium]